MSIHIKHGSKGVFSLYWGGHSTFLVRLRNKKSFGEVAEEKSQQSPLQGAQQLEDELSVTTPSSPPPHTLLLPPPCQMNEALTHLYHDKCLNDSYTPLYVLFPFSSFGCAILLACAIYRLPGISQGML